MIELSLQLTADGCLRGFDVTGHAGGAAAGTDVVCAAVTALARSVADTLLSAAELDCRVAAPAPGQLQVAVAKLPASHRHWLRGVSAVLVVGGRRIAAEHPAQVRYKVEAAQSVVC